MELSFKEKEGNLRVCFHGELDHHVAGGLGNKIDFEILVRAPKKVVLDYEDMTFMDSSGLAVIMGRYQTCNRLSIPISIEHLAPSIKKILLMTGIQKYVEIREEDYETV